MTAAARPARRASPARCDLVTVCRLTYARTLPPCGHPARVTVNGEPYAVTCDKAEPSPWAVYIFHAEGGRTHLVCRGTCTCEDFLTAPCLAGGACEHLTALAQMKADGTV